MKTATLSEVKGHESIVKLKREPIPTELYLDIVCRTPEEADLLRRVFAQSHFEYKGVFPTDAFLLVGVPQCYETRTNGPWKPRLNALEQKILQYLHNPVTGEHPSFTDPRFITTSAFDDAGALLENAATLYVKERPYR